LLVDAWLRDTVCFLNMVFIWHVPHLIIFELINDHLIGFFDIEIISWAKWFLGVGVLLRVLVVTIKVSWNVIGVGHENELGLVDLLMIF